MRSTPVLLACAGLACAPKGTASALPATPGPTATLPIDPSVTTGTLGNGLTWFIEENPFPAGRAELRLVVRAGSVLERPDQWGGAHFVEHMAFNGTRDFPGNDLIAFLESAGIDFGAHLNAYTSFDETVYQLQVPTDDPHLLIKAISVLDNWAEGIVFDPEEVERERGVVLEEWRSGRGAGARTWDTTRPVLYAGSAYGDHDVIGTEESLKSMTREALVDFYDTWYRPDLMAVAVVGELDAAAVQAEIEAAFGDNGNPPNATPRTAVVLPPQDGVRVLSQADPELTRSTISLLETTPWSWPTDEAGIKRLFVEDLAYDILRLRLSERAQEPDTPFLGAGVGYEDLNRVQGFRTYGAAARVGQELAALEAVLTEVRRLELHGVHGSELDMARRNRLDGARSWLQTEDHAPSSDAIEEIVRHFLDDEWMAGTAGEVAFYEKILPSISTDDIAAFARTLRTRESQLVLAEVPGAEGSPGAPSDDAVRAVVAAAESAAVDPWPEPEAVGTLIEVAPTPGVVVETQEFAELGVLRWRLSNGATVLVKPTPLAKNEILMRGWSKGGHSVVPDADYTNAAYAASIAMLSGIGDFDLPTLNRFLSGKQAAVRASLSSTREALSATTRPDDLELTLQMLHQRFLAPRFDADVLKLEKTNGIERLRRRLANPSARLGDFLADVRFNNHLRARPWTEADLETLDLDALERLYKDRFANAADFQFVFVGDLDPTVLQPLVETWIGSLPGDPDTTESVTVSALPVPNTGPRRETLKAGTEPQAQVRIFLDAVRPFTRQGLHRNGILSDLLSQALRIRIREDLGGSYGVGVSIQQPDIPGERVQTTIRFACDPERVEELLAATLDTVDRLREAPIDPEALQRVLAQAKRKRELDLQQNASWASWLIRYPARGWALEDISRHELAYGDLLAGDTPGALHALAQETLDTRTAFVVVQLPEDSTAAPTDEATD